MGRMVINSEASCLFAQTRRAELLGEAKLCFRDLSCKIFLPFAKQTGELCSLCTQIKETSFDLPIKFVIINS